MSAGLRPWAPADADALLRSARSSPDLERQFGELTDRDAASALIERRLIPGDGRLVLAIAIDGEAVGAVGAVDIDLVHGTAWVWYWLRESARGRGYASAGLVTLADLAFDELGLARLELGHRVDNPASCVVARRAGFVAEGIERQKLQYGGRRFDVETHARLSDDLAPDAAGLPLVV